MNNIVVTGSKGQLGSEIRELSSQYNYNFLFTDKDTLDITDEKIIKEFIEKNNIDLIINCAAYTAVDKAEEDEKSAEAINHLAVKYLAKIAKDKDIKLIHISTDYVFDGKNYKPYNEDDKTNPNAIYGATKLAGEKAMQKINPVNSIIIRTSWVYSSFGANFVKTMLRLGKDKKELGVVFDQVGTPTYAKDLAKAILDILESNVLTSAKHSNVEIYHYSNEGVLSWYDFAKEIMHMAKIACEINPIETKEYLALNADAPVPKGKVGRPTPATRPHYSLLNKAKIKKKFGIIIPHWKDSLDKCLKILGERR
jgi:dTDP-4-dehydrorhamnose reductase